VRVLAWLQTAPVNPTEEHRNLSHKKSNTPEPTTRIQEMLNKGEQPDLPEVFGGLYLVEYLMDAGPGSVAGMGMVPITWPDLAAWQDQIGIQLAPWESKMLRRLSGEYLAQARKSEQPDCPSPAYTPLTDEVRDAVANRLGNALDTLIDTRPKR
jgi:hypothetical protein